MPYAGNRATLENIMKTGTILLLAAKRLGVDAYETKGVVKALSGARWVPIATEHELRKIAARARALQMPTQWMSRTTRHPFAY